MRFAEPGLTSDRVSQSPYGVRRAFNICDLRHPGASGPPGQGTRSPLPQEQETTFLGRSVEGRTIGSVRLWEMGALVVVVVVAGFTCPYAVRIAGGSRVIPA